MTRRGLFATFVAALWPKKPLIVAPAIPIGQLWSKFRYGPFQPVKLPKPTGSTIKMYRFKEIA